MPGGLYLYAATSAVPTTTSNRKSTSATIVRIQTQRPRQRATRHATRHTTPAIALATTATNPTHLCVSNRIDSIACSRGLSVRQSAESSAGSAEKGDSSPRKRFLSTLPAGFRGSGSSRSSTYSGTLKLARRAEQWVRSSSSVAVDPGFSCTTALTSSPSTLCGTPTTAASATSGCSNSTCSTSTQYTFSPPPVLMP